MLLDKKLEKISEKNFSDHVFRGVFRAFVKDSLEPLLNFHRVKFSAAQGYLLCGARS